MSAARLSAGTPWSANGRPVLGAGDVGVGGIEVDINGVDSQMDYNVTSLKAAPRAAPEIDAASAAGGLTLLLGTLVVLRGRRLIKPENAAA